MVPSVNWLQQVFRLCLLDFQIAVLITDGKSQDNVEDPAQRLHSQGVHIFAIGRCALIYSSGLRRKNISLDCLVFFRCKECRHK